MTVVSLEGFTPSPRFDGNAWTQARIEQAESITDVPTPLETQLLDPVDTDPTSPAERNFTTALATLDSAWFRIVFIDAAANEQASGWVYHSPATYQTRGRTAAELIEEAIEEFGFDLTEARGLKMLNARYSKMVAEARWLRVTIDLGVTVADQASYAVDPDVVELYELTIGGLGYTKGRRQDMIAGRQNRLSLRGTGGLFIPDADASGTDRFTIYPVPGSPAGDAIQAFAAVQPPELGLNDRPLVPVDFLDGLVEGMIATGLARDSEQLNAADRFEARFNAEVERLRLLAKRRLRGSGPRQIRVVGINA